MNIIYSLCITYVVLLLFNIGIGNYFWRKLTIKQQCNPVNQAFFVLGILLYPLTYVIFAGYFSAEYFDDI